MYEFRVSARVEEDVIGQVSARLNGDVIGQVFARLNGDVIGQGNLARKSVRRQVEVSQRRHLATCAHAQRVFILPEVLVVVHGLRFRLIRVAAGAAQFVLGFT